MKNKTRLFITILIFLSAITPFVLADEESKWPGVDETVVEKIAEEHGRTAWTPFINTDQGDLLLFIFLLAGICGGFIMGYNYHKLFKRNGPKN